MGNESVGCPRLVWEFCIISPVIQLKTPYALALSKNKTNLLKQTHMDINKINEIKTEDEARQYAADWQEWQSNQSLSYGEVAQWQEAFAVLAKRFGLEEEFKENLII